MNVISRSRISQRLFSNSHLTNGLLFLSRFRTENIMSRATGFSPAIVGGAVRDVVFEGRDPNDIDIFIYRNRDLSRTEVQNSTEAFNNIREDLILWLEDQDIEHRSLLSDSAAQYDADGNRFLDIIDFVWNGTNIQVMIPRTLMHCASSVKGLISTMPLVSAAALTLEHLVFSDAFLGAQYLKPSNIYPAATDRDFAYLNRKHPEGEILRVTHSDAILFPALSQRALVRYFNDVRPIPTNMENTPVFNATTLVRAGIQEMFPEVGDDFSMRVVASLLEETL